MNFRGTENLVIGNGGGQASINSQDGTFDFFEITLADPDLQFTKLVFNLDATADGFAHFEAENSDGNVFDFPDFALDKTGKISSTSLPRITRSLSALRFSRQMILRSSQSWNK